MFSAAYIVLYYLYSFKKQKKKKNYSDAKARQLIYNMYHMLYDLHDPNSWALIFVNRKNVFPIESTNQNLYHVNELNQDSNPKIGVRYCS